MFPRFWPGKPSGSMSSPRLRRHGEAARYTPLGVPVPAGWLCRQPPLNLPDCGVMLITRRNATEDKRTNRNRAIPKDLNFQLSSSTSHSGVFFVQRFSLWNPLNHGRGGRQNCWPCVCQRNVGVDFNWGAIAGIGYLCSPCVALKCAGFS